MPLSDPLRRRPVGLVEGTTRPGAPGPSGAPAGRRLARREVPA